MWRLCSILACLAAAAAPAAADSQQCPFHGILKMMQPGAQLQHSGMHGAHHGAGRSLLQTSSNSTAEFDNSASFAAVAEDESVFILGSNFSGRATNLATNLSYTVGQMTASVELDDGPSYSSNFDINNPATWEGGNSRVNVSIQLSYGSTVTAMPASLTAELHSGACSSTSRFNQSTLYHQFGNETNTNTSAVIFSVPINSTNQGVASTTVPYLIDYDSTESIVLFNSAGAAIACATFTPPFPDFPPDWASTIEVTIVNKGYTFAFSQYYSTSNNAMRQDLHSNGTDRVLIESISGNSTTIISGANSTYPHGVCQTRSLSQRFANFSTDENSALLSTAEFLRFVGNSNATYVPGHQSVRGIECEVWTYNITSTNRNASYGVYFFFPVNQWQVGREDYHRLLKRIYLYGTRNGTTIQHYYDFVNMRPLNEPDAVFEPCALAPLGSGCGCTKSLLAQLARNESGSSLVAESADGVVLDPSSSYLAGLVEDSSTSSNSCKGYTGKQSGWYVLFVVVGAIIGVLVTVVGNLLWNMFRNGGGLRRHAGHERFQDAPAGTSKLPPFQFGSS